jgi:hypothetical protein
LLSRKRAHILQPPSDRENNLISGVSSQKKRMAHKESPMLRNFVLLLSLLCLLAICAMTINCGSSSSSNNGGGCTGGPFNVVGDWNLTFNGNAGSAGVINTAGLALFFDSFGDVFAGPTITGTCSFSGTATLFATPLGGGIGGVASATGNVNSATSISGTATTNGSSAPFSAAPISPLSGAPIALSASLLGVIQADPGANIWDLTFTPTGTGQGMTVSGTNVAATCTVSGTLTQEGSNNVFDSAIAFSGAGCPFPDINGLALESNSDYFNVNGGAAGTYLYAISSTSAAVLEVFGAGTLSAPRHDVMGTGSFGHGHFSF